MDVVTRVKRSERGQASVELVAALPALLLVAALVWQCSLAGYSAWMAAHAARSAARAELVGQDAKQAARSALPDGLEQGLKVEHEDGGAVRVSVQVPFLLQRWRSPVAVGAVAALGGER